MENYYLQTLEKKLNALKEQGNYRYFLDLNKSARHFPKFYFDDEKGQKKMATNWCSNDYLCMSIDEEVISKLSFTAHHSGVGSSGTRNISGSTGFHKQLEETIAQLHQKENALIFNSAFMANYATIATLGKAFNETVFISDEQNHASIIEGVKSSGCEKHVFKHNDMNHLSQILENIPANKAKIVLFESVYSISGDVAPANEICALAKKYNALTYADEVHAVGIFGKHGSGMLAALGCADQVDIINGTFAKSFGTIGGYIASNNIVIDFIRSFGSGFIFTTSLPPAICAATIKSITKIIAGDAVRSLYLDKVKQLRNILTAHNIKYNNNHSHITPILIGDSIVCKQIADRLLNEFNLYLQPINPPTVKEGEACLRIAVSSRHTENDMLQLAKALASLLP